MNLSTKQIPLSASALLAFAMLSACGGGGSAAPAPAPAPAPQVTMMVSNGAGVNGTIVITLAADKAPITVKNFLAYVNAGFYNGTVIHRVVPNFVVQGGGYAGPVDASTAPAAIKATNAPIKLEAGVGLSNTQWTIAMARTSVADSATSQFFINLVDNSAILDANATSAPPKPGYAVFGSVSAGTDIVAAAVAAPCTATQLVGPGECTPIPNVVVTSAVQSR